MNPLNSRYVVDSHALPVQPSHAHDASMPLRSAPRMLARTPAGAFRPNLQCSLDRNRRAGPCRSLPLSPPVPRLGGSRQEIILPWPEYFLLACRRRCHLFDGPGQAIASLRPGQSVRTDFRPNYPFSGWRAVGRRNLCPRSFTYLARIPYQDANDP